MTSKRSVVLFLTTVILALSACSAGHMITDDEVRKLFAEHRADFQQVADALSTERDPYICIINYGCFGPDKFDITYQDGIPPNDPGRISPKTLQICKNFLHEFDDYTIEKNGETIVFRLATQDRYDAKFLEYEKNRFKNTGRQNSEIVDKSAIGPEGYSAVNADWGIDYIYRGKRLKK